MSAQNQNCGNQMRAGEFSKTLFVMGDFPAFSQTFILRELKEFEQRGIPLRVIAYNEDPERDLEPWLRELKGRTRYIGKVRSCLQGGGRLALSPVKLAGALKWALGLPHRSAYHRSRFIYTLVIASDLAPWVKKHFNYIHAHFAAFQTELAMCLSYLTGIPWGATWHAYGIWKDKNILEQKIAGAQTIMTCTKFNVDHLKALSPQHADKIHLVYHGLPIAQHRLPVPVPNDSVSHFTAVGRLIPKKGFSYLVDAMAILKERGVGCRLTIIGDGDERASLTEQIEKQGVSEMVVLAGQCKNEEVLSCLENSRGLVAPSIQAADGDIDGIPNVLLEAMIAGRAIVGTKMSGIPEVIEEGVNGYLVPPEDSTSLADAMEKVCSSREHAESLGSAGRRFVEKEFDVTRSVDQQIEILGNIRL